MSREVQEGWAKRCLGDIMEFQNGFAFKPADWSSSGLPIVRIQNLNGGDEFNYYDGFAPSQFGVKSGDILFCWSGSRGTSFGPRRWQGGKGWLNQHIFRCDLKSGIDDDFAFYILDHLTGSIEQAAHGGAGLVHIKKSELVKFEALLPPLHEQRRIAEVLSSVDDAIATTRAVIEQTRKVKQGVLECLLTKGIGHTRFKQTEIGEIPEGWVVAKLFDVLSEPVRNGYSPISPKNPTGGWLLSLGSLSEDGLSDAYIKPAPLHDQRMAPAKLSFNDVVLSRSNTPDRVGMVGIYKGLPDNCYFPDLMICLRFKRNVVLPDFGSIWLHRLRQSGYFMRAAAGTSASMVKINRSLLSQVQIAVPSIREQEEIVARTSDIRRTIGVSEDQLAALTTTKSALMSDLLTGRKRVTETLPMAAE